MSALPFNRETVNDSSFRVSGIYCIVQLSSGKVYIGSATSIRDRIKTHYSSLNLNRHYNRHLQRAWSKYGAEDFVFKVLEYCPAEKLESIEQSHIEANNATDTSLGFNICTEAGRPPKGNLTEAGRKRLSELSRQRMQDPDLRAKLDAARRARKGIPTGPRDEAFKEKRRQHMLGNKLNVGRVYTEEEKERSRQRMIGNTYGVGVPASEKCKAAASLTHKGKPKSPETRERMRIAALNRTPEHSAKIAKTIQANRRAKEKANL